jgi:hypothetical protein
MLVTDVDSCTDDKHAGVVNIRGVNITMEVEMTN